MKLKGLRLEVDVVDRVDEEDAGETSRAVDLKHRPRSAVRAVNDVKSSGSSGRVLFPTVFADAVDLKGVAGGVKVIAAADVFFQLPYFGRKEFNRDSAVGTNHVVVAAAVELVLVAGNAIVEGNFTGKAAFGQQFQSAIHSGEPDLGIFLSGESEKLIR